MQLKGTESSHNPQSATHLFTSTSENNQSVITTFIKSTSDDIHTAENQRLDKQILAVKKNTNIYNETIQKITQLNRNYSSSLQKRIINQHTQQRSINNFIKKTQPSIP